MEALFSDPQIGLNSCLLFLKNKLTIKIFKFTLAIFSVCRKHAEGKCERLADNFYGQLLLFLYMLT